MLICISSDHHYHSYAMFADRKADGVNSRLAEMLAVEDWLHEFMLKFKVRVHVRCGDLWEHKNAVDSVVMTEVVKRIYANNQAGILEVALKGNHDVAGGGVRSNLEVLREADIAAVIDQPEGLCVDEFPEVNLVGVPFDETPGRTAEVLRKLEPKEDRINLLFLHCAPEGAVSGSEYPVPCTVTLEDICPDKWDHVFIGHIHQPQSLAPNVYIVGSFCQRSFSDVGMPRRVFVYDTDNGELTSINVPGPKFQIVTVDTKATLKKLVPQSDCYYKVVHSEKVARHHIDEHLAGKVRGLVVSPSASNVTPAHPGVISRLPAFESNWLEVFKSYVDLQPDNKLDHKRLLKMGEQIYSDAGSNT